jgi:hypothetical protein
MEKFAGLLAALAIGLPITITDYPLTAQAQTKGMEHRDDRRDSRQVSREVKQACKAGDEKSRAECRNVKHDVKQEGRQNGPSSTTTNPH